MARPRLPIDETAVLEAYTAGETVPGIALRLNVDRSRVDRVLNDHDVARRSDRGRHWGDKRTPSNNHPAKPAPLVGHTPDWMLDAACARPGINPELFFPSSFTSSAREAVLVCSDCPVAKQCAVHALDNDERDGVWGGLTPHRRTRLRKNPALPIPAITIPRERPTAPTPRGPRPVADGARICPRCDNEIPKAPNGGQLKYCSDACRDAARRASYRRYASKRRTAS